MIYSDPLHVPYQDLCISHRGKTTMLNKRLLDRQNCWENLDKIKALHAERLNLEDMMRETISEKGAYLLSVEDAPDKMSSMELRLACQNAILKECYQYNDFLMLCNEYYTLIELELQEAWGFTQDKNFHKFWNRPGCICPSMDNDDRYPYGPYIHTTDCSLHGFFYLEEPTIWEKIKNFFKGV